MPRFFFHLRTETELEPDYLGIRFSSLEHAYLEACRGIPGVASDFIASGRDPLGFQFEIANAAGTFLMEVPFRELLRPQTLHIHPSARKAMIEAVQRYAPMFEHAAFGAQLLTPDLEWVHMNDPLLRMTGVLRADYIGISMDDPKFTASDREDSMVRACAMMDTARRIKRPVPDAHLLWPEHDEHVAGTFNHSCWPVLEHDEVVALAVIVKVVEPLPV